MTKKIFRSIFLITITVLLLGLFVVAYYLYSYFGRIQQEQLENNLDFIASAVEQIGSDYLENIDSTDYRITWVAPDGTVLYDTQALASTMDNHSDRKEIQDSLAYGEGYSERYSTTLTEKTIYYAKTLFDGTVLRISESQSTVITLFLGIIPLLILIAFIALILSHFVAKRVAKHIIAPLNDIDLNHPLSGNSYEEIAPFLAHIHNQHKQIKDQFEQLSQRNNEFAQITANMKEGLVLLDVGRYVLSINPAACALFGVRTNCISSSFLTIDRSRTMSNAIQTAFDEGHAEFRTERNGRLYQFDISRIDTDGTTVGAIILAFDVTEQDILERNRKEFTANVSHELKTPLQSIIGSAELIENGLLDTKDIPRFIGHIRTEATRLVILIEDIIRLSQLDEGEQLLPEPLDLYNIANDCIVELSDAAKIKDVTISIIGESCPMNGIKRLVYEIVYNLIDNAIKYNTVGGRVDVYISDNAKHILTVTDTGIGIPQEHQSRVFERFYRVDKSHSKSSGGTGLGLSIVKHAARLLNADISLQSAPGEGTTVTISFP